MRYGWRLSRSSGGIGPRRYCRCHVTQRKGLRVGWEVILLGPASALMNDPLRLTQKKRFGDWEMVAVVGKNDKGVIVSMVECTAEKLLMAKSPRGKNAKAVAKLVVQLLKPFWTACPSHHHRQHVRVRWPQVHRQKTAHIRLLCPSLLLLGKGVVRKRKQTGSVFCSQRHWFLFVVRWLHSQYTIPD